MNLPVQYFATIAHFLIKPWEFFRRRDAMPADFMNPYAFLATNLALSGTFGVAGVQLFGGERSTFTALEVTLIIGAVAAVHCLIAVGGGKLAGAILNERTDVSELLTAFCYPSVFYIPLAALMTAIDAMSATSKNQMPQVLLLTSVQVIALGYLLVSMALSSSLYGRRLIAFTGMAGMFVAICVVLLTAGFVMLHDEHTVVEPYPPAATAAVAMQNGYAMGAVTVGIRNLTPQSVELVGAPIGPTSREWFDFDDEPKMEHSVDAKNGYGLVRVLKPNTKYYFRYVAQHGAMTCSGDAQSFTTPAK